MSDTAKPKLPDTYRYQYRLVHQYGQWRHHYELIGRRGGLDFHITDLGEERVPDRYSAGLEFHYREPPSYMATKPPSRDCCHLLNAPCWHDGTSLYAHEKLLPRFDGMDHEQMFRALVVEANRAFESDDESA